MTSTPPQGRNVSRPAGDGFSLVLELCLTDGDPVSGTIGVSGGPPANPFHGWIDLMSAINNLRAGTGKTG